MLAPIVNFAQLRTASFGGDVRAFIWVLAWDNHAVLDRVPSLFDANKLFPLQNSLAYGEHLFGISLFTLPIYAATRNPVLAYNVVWILAYLLTAAAVHVAGVAVHAGSSGGDDRRAGVHVLLLPHAPRPRPPQSDLVLLDSALVPRDGSLDGAADLDPDRRLDGGHRPSSARRVVSGGPDCGRRPDLLRLAVRGGTADDAVVPRARPGTGGRARGVRAGVAVRASLLHPSRRAAIVRGGGFRGSRRLAGAAREHVDGAMAPGARRQGAEMDLGRAHRLPRMDHARARRGRRRRLDAKPRRPGAPRSLLHRPWRDRSGAGTGAVRRAKSHPDRSAGRRSVSWRTCQG